MLKRIHANKFLAILALLASCLLLLQAGCKEERSWKNPGPADTFEQFLADWFRGERETAFESIAPQDRRVLVRSRDELRGKLDDEQLPSPDEMLIPGRVDNPYDLEKIEPETALKSAPTQGQQVTLSLSYHDGRKGQATMVWGGDRWYVDLPLDRPQADSPSGSPGTGRENQDRNPKAEPATDAGRPDATANETSSADSQDAEK